MTCSQLQGLGFSRMHGVDGSRGMLEIARQKGLYQELKHCILGQEPLPLPTGNEAKLHSWRHSEMVFCPSGQLPRNKRGWSCVQGYDSYPHGRGHSYKTSVVRS